MQIRTPNDGYDFSNILWITFNCIHNYRNIEKFVLFLQKVDIQSGSKSLNTDTLGWHRVRVVLLPAMQMFIVYLLKMEQSYRGIRVWPAFQAKTNSQYTTTVCKVVYVVVDYCCLFPPVVLFFLVGSWRATVIDPRRAIQTRLD